MFSKIVLSVATAVGVMALFCPGSFAQRPKILALHGAYGSPFEFRTSKGMVDLEKALPEFKFVYPKAAYAFPPPPECDNCNVWIGGAESTTVTISDDSIAVLDEIVEEEGPFYAILGYSQGAAYIQTYLSNVPVGTFQKAIMFCGYIEKRHTGLVDQIIEKQPWGDISSLIWIGLLDFVIYPKMTRKTKQLFTKPLVIESQTGTHLVPGTGNPTFESVVAYIREAEPVAVCGDDLEISIKGKGCDWVAENPAERCELNVQKQKVASICPATCGLCP